MPEAPEAQIPRQRRILVRTSSSGRGGYAIIQTKRLSYAGGITLFDDNSSCFSFLAAISSSVMLQGPGLSDQRLPVSLHRCARQYRVNSVQYLHMILAHAEQFRVTSLRSTSPRMARSVNIDTGCRSCDS